MQKILQTIQENQSHYTQSQRAVANYISANYATIPFQTLADIAECIGVSETTVFLFCKELGFNGFSDFKRVVTTYVNNFLPLNNRLSSTAANLCVEDVPTEIARCDAENVEATLTNPTNLETIPRLLDLIDQAKHIYTIGGRSANFFADFLAFKLRQQRLIVTNINFEHGEFIDEAMQIGPDDLLIVFSFPRYTKSIVMLTKKLKEIGTHIALITSEKLSPCSEYAELVLSCRTVSYSYVASYSGVLTMINTILTCRALRHEKEIEEYLRKLDNNLREFDMFYN